MGLWEDAQQQNQVARAAQDSVAAVIQRQQQDINEFIAAMHQLGVAPERFPLCKLALVSDTSWAEYVPISAQFVDGWKIHSSSAHYGPKQRITWDHLVVTTDGRLINTGQQEKPQKRGLFRAPEPFVARYVALPVSPQAYLSGLRTNLSGQPTPDWVEGLSSYLAAALASHMGS